jgi:hypothetical protein
MLTKSRTTLSVWTRDVSIAVWPWLLRVLRSDVQCRRIQVSDPHNGKRVRYVDLREQPHRSHLESWDRKAGTVEPWGLK